MKKLLCKNLLALSLTCLSITAGAETLKVTLVDSRAESGLSEAVVEVIPLAEGQVKAVPIETSVDQVDKEFVSGVTVVPVGSRISFPNSDEILHHVYSFSSAKSFDIPLYGAGDNLDRYELFDKPGVVEIGCNIHDWMLAYIYVTDSKLTGKTNASGTVVIGGLGPGRYSVKIWHARMDHHKSLHQEVEIVAGADRELSLTLDLAPERRIRRAPSAARGRYR